MLREHRGSLGSFLYRSPRVIRMDRITVFARCGNAKLYHLDPITREIKPLYRVRPA